MRVLIVALILALPVVAYAEHATIKLTAKRVDAQTGKTLAEASAAGDEEPPEGGENRRPILKAKINEPLVLQFTLTNIYPHGELKDVTIRYYVVRQDKLGQKKLPNIDKGTVTAGRFLLNMKAKGRVGARVAFTISEPGAYLLRVQTANTKSDHEHFSALDLQVE